VNAFEVKEELHNGLAHTLKGGEFVRNALNLDLGDRRARERGEDNAAERVAECVTVARIERIYLVDALQSFFRNNTRLTRKCDVVFHNAIVITN